jgi:hypothetical protein
MNYSNDSTIKIYYAKQIMIVCMMFALTIMIGIIMMMFAFFFKDAYILPTLEIWPAPAGHDIGP